MTNKKTTQGEIIIYKPKKGKTEIKVNLKDETVWLSQKQLSELFNTERSVITKHINNIYKTNELDKKATCAKIAQVQIEGKRSIVRQIAHYNLDLIISVGYRVNSKSGTQFRIWATQILKDYIIKGYAVNEKRLKEQNARLLELQDTVNMMGKLIETHDLQQSETEGLLKVVTDYSYALSVLDKYDRQELKVQKTTKKKGVVLTYEKAIEAIKKLGDKQKGDGQQIGFFGKEKDKSFRSSIASIYQTFDRKPLYPSLEEKAAHLLYFVIKNHSFIDGNKRIAAALFIWFLEENRILYDKNGKKRIGDNALVAITLLIAESTPKEKNTIIKVVINLINKDN